MSAYVLRRLGQSVLTILGVMIITFLLFRQVAGDIAAANLGPKATEQQKAAWRQRYGYHKPKWVNLDKRLMIVDHTEGARPLGVRDAGGSRAAEALTLILSDRPIPGQPGRKKTNELSGRYSPGLWWRGRLAPIGSLTGGASLLLPPPKTPPQTSTAPASTQPPETPEKPALRFLLADGSTLDVHLAEVRTAEDLIDRIHNAPENKGRLSADISEWNAAEFFDSQFFHHLVDSAMFQTRSLKDNKPLTQIIRDHAPASLAITVPAMALEWCFGLVIACFVAYYRDSRLDKAGVFLSVLGMSIPFLGFMMLGHWLVNRINPEYAYGLIHRPNVYLPIVIMVIAGLGGMVRFYRTVILDETNRDYVRTALAKGVPLTSVLFKHVLKNCMLPILTSLILSIPFLMMGSLLLETYFGIPGLGDLMITSINNRDEPVMNGLVFLTALIYTLGVLITDLCYAVFDPRIRLR